MDRLVQKTVEYCYKYKDHHVLSALSALPIIRGIYQTFRFGRDVFILSKGHGCMGWYVVLEEWGFKPDLNKKHPDIDPENGIFCTTGSLGHGLPVGAGIALADPSRTVHVLMGDGECQEGTTWESLLVARKFKLKNLWIHIDGNGYQACGPDLYFAAERLQATFTTLNIKVWDYPKGYGVKFFEEHPTWHVHQISDDEFIFLNKHA
jgi:transketolase N-terminal domain/subunit